MSLISKLLTIKLLIMVISILKNLHSGIKKIAAQEDVQSSKVHDQCQNTEEVIEFSNTGYNTPLATKFSSKNQLKKQYWSKRLPGGK